MTSTRCPSFEQLATSLDSPGSAAEHARGCAECGGLLGALRSIDAAARALPAFEPDPRRVAAIQARLLAPPPGHRRVAPLAVAASLLLVAIAGLLAGRLTALPDTPVASVVGAPGAIFEHVASYSTPGRLERVELARGRVSIDVRHLRPDQRFLVTTEDAEVEVRGTSFDVEAEEGRLKRVAVREGLVEVRPRGGAAALLGAGRSWTRPPPASVAARPAIEKAATVAPPAPGARLEAGRSRVETSGAPGRPRVAVPAPPDVEIEEPAAADPPPDPAPHPAPDAERSFAAGWAALREGHASRAAELMAAVVDATPFGPLAEDARYWRIVALQRAGRDRAAAFEAEGFLRDLPSSARAGEVAVLAGVSRLGDGETEIAARLFRGALTDPDPHVRARARDGLRAVQAASGR